MNMEHEYLTRDIGEATALVATGLPMRDIQWKNDTAFFIFRDPKRCEDLAREYYFGNLTINARIFYETIRTVKRKLYESNQGGGKRR